jgi:hypothetical protein
VERPFNGSLKRPMGVAIPVRAAEMDAREGGPEAGGARSAASPRETGKFVVIGLIVFEFNARDSE